MDCFSGSNVLDDLEQDEDHIFGEIKRNRQCTDKGFLIGMGVFFVVLFGFLGYCIGNGDLDRFINGYDDCGNICGKNNIKTDSIPFSCFGQNMEEKKYLLYETRKEGIYEITTKTCVTDCKSHGAYLNFLNRCFPNPSKDDKITINSTFQELAEDFQMCWKHIILLSFLALVFSIIMMILMRYATAFVVWFVLIGISLLLIGLSTYLWILYSQSSTEKDGALALYFAVLVSIFTFILLLIIIIMGKRIKLVIQLFKEAAKAIAAMPLLLFQPVLTFLVLCIILFFGFYTSLWILSGGNLQMMSREKTKLHSENLDSLDYEFSAHSEYIDYELNNVEIFTSIYNYIAVIWIIQFVVGCQHMIIGGSVATWFFARNKDNLGTPIITSTLNLLKYHLGTIALGSLIITIVEIVKSIVRYMKAKLSNRNSIIACLFNFCLAYVLELVETFLKYFSRNAYIQTAVHGYSFCKGGTRAFKLLINNIFKVAAINSVGDYVLFFTKVFIVISTLFVGAEIFRENDKIHHMWFPLVIVGFISFFIAHCFITVFEMAIDTIFLCFCEDCEYNDGLSKPYFMSRNLMEFVENSNKVVNHKNWNFSDQEAWDNGPKRILQQGS